MDGYIPKKSKLKLELKLIFFRKKMEHVRRDTNNGYPNTHDGDVRPKLLVRRTLLRPPRNPTQKHLRTSEAVVRPQLAQTID